MLRKRSLSQRLGLMGFYALWTLLFAALWLLCLARPAWAYVDPSVMTYTIQALAGVVVALSAMFGVIFRRTRRKIYQLLNIDENANKAVEGDIERVDPANANAAERLGAADTAARELSAQASNGAERRGLSRLDTSYLRRFAYALVICLFFAFMVLIAPAIELVGSNSDSLVFGLGSIWWVSVLFNVAFAVAASAVLASLKGKPFLITLLVVFCVTIAAYVQSLFLNRGMMPADGGFIGWTEPYFVRKMIISGIIWLAIIAAPLAFSRKHRYNWLRATTVVAVLLMVVQAFGVGSAAIKGAKATVETSAQPYVTQQGLFTLDSNGNNVVVFVLDTYDTNLLEQLRAKEPTLLDNFTDFTYFRNSAGTMIPTSNAIPYLVTGQKPALGQDLGQYRHDKYANSTFLKDLSDRGYSIGLYSDSLMLDYRNPADRDIAARTLNIHPVSRAPIHAWRTFICMNQMALYREAPWVLKPTFWYYTSDINNRMIADSDDTSGSDSLYELDDAKVKQMLTSQGVTPESDGSAGAFRFIHLFGPHFPFSVDAEGNAVGTNRSNQLDQARGSLMVVDEYLTMLKQEGLYDSATIIVTADHGVWSESEDPVKNAISPIMLVKPATDGSNPQPLQVSEMPISHEDVIPTVMDAVGADPSQYASGQTVWQIDDPSRVRYFDATTNAGNLGQRFVEYQITGDALNVKNWKKTGNVWLGA